MLLLTFPNFNIYSTSLLFLVLQGFLFAFLLLRRYVQKRHLADLFLALLLIITGYRRTSYIIGFMEWYDTFRNTKINYLLFDVTFILGPLIFFYVKSLTKVRFSFRRVDWIHFVPVILYVCYEICMWIYDAMQPDFHLSQNGYWVENIDSVYVAPFAVLLGFASQLLYYAFAVQAYWHYRERIKQHFSNTYQVELNWIRNFLTAYIVLFAFQFIINVIDHQIVALHWKQNWWGHLAGALVMLYVGTKGYFTDLSKLYQLTFGIKKEEIIETDADFQKLEQQKTELLEYLETEKPYLNPELTLAELARKMKTTTSNLSKVINTGFDKNFKDFINEYRVEAVKERLKNGDTEQFTLLAIAFDSGFNSKATFNRTFKKFTDVTPSQYLENTSS
ncbi:MAG: helix-turn-helix transcriptional regulator [Chitinophagales bacterium]